jgi:hypothetical protein
MKLIVNQHPQVCEALGLSYKNSNELNKIIDQWLPGCPAFHRHEVVVGGEAFEFFSPNIINCIKGLWADVDFASHLVVEPEHHYIDADHTIHHFFDMHTGKWWWCTQACLLRLIKLLHMLIRHIERTGNTDWEG